jgi:acetyl esterase/lipase
MGTLTPSTDPIRLPYGIEPEQFGELFLPGAPGPYPTAILVHGGFWRNCHGYNIMTSLAEDLTARGFATWNIEYRRIGDPGGGWPGTLLDVAHAADFLRTLSPTYTLDLERVVSIGHSAGGHLALWLAARQHLTKADVLPTDQDDTPLPLVGVISLAGVSDLDMCWKLKLSDNVVEEFLGGSPDSVPERYAIASPAALLPLGVPQVLIHGTEDEDVPFQMSEVYAAAAAAAGDHLTLITLEGVEHLALINSHSDAWAKTVEALEKMGGRE